MGQEWIEEEGEWEEERWVGKGVEGWEEQVEENKKNVIINTLFSEGNSWSDTLLLNRTITDLFNMRPSTNYDYKHYETLLINTYIFGGWGWRWWQYIDIPNNNINTCIICI